MSLIKKQNQQRLKGVTLVEVLISIFLLLVVTLSFYGMIMLAGKIVADSKLRTMGLYLANEEIETIKSMAYNNIGTVGGVPSGELPPVKNIEKGGYSFQVKTEVKFLDDEMDGVFPEDENPSDYKVVRLEVIWPSSFKKKEAILITSIYPDILEQAGTGGILSINVINFEGVGVIDCDVEISNANLDPPVLINTGTDDIGNVTLYGMPASQDGYQIKLERSGYETVTTLPPYPTSSFHPVDEHIIVVAGQLNARSLQLDELGDVTVMVKNESGLAVAGLGATMQGGRIIGYTEDVDPQPVYFFDESNLATNAEGIINVADASPGNYNFSINDSSYELININPASPFDLPAGGIINVQATCVENTVDSVLVVITDNETKEPIQEASVSVVGFDYNATNLTDTLGKAFFWEELMEQGEYQIGVTADGYEEYNGTVDLLGLTKEEVYLTAIE
ncbi:MAG: hypothetical protein U9Q72_02985 [Patescibacteria group bacterium]|nr:hypothetical protein [Patescibacteria group bacterium]